MWNRLWGATNVEPKFFEVKPYNPRPSKEDCKNFLEFTSELEKLTVEPLDPLQSLRKFSALGTFCELVLNHSNKGGILFFHVGPLRAGWMSYPGRLVSVSGSTTSIESKGYEPTRSGWCLRDLYLHEYNEEVNVAIKHLLSKHGLLDKWAPSCDQKTNPPHTLHPRES
jgi:hypothetical protein